MKSLATLSLISVASALAQAPAAPKAANCENPPAKGYSGPKDGGIFTISLPKGALGKGALPKSGDGGSLNQAPKSWDFLCKRVNGSTFPTGPAYPKTGVKRLERGGTGPYKSAPAGRTDESLPNHTIYAPLQPPPKDVKLPVIVFGEGGCTGVGTMFPDFLAEIASHGYLILANGNPGPVPQDQYSGDSGLANAIAAAKGARTYPSMQTDSINWVLSGKGSKYGNIDTTKIAAMGQSCGGLESYAASYKDDRVKLTVLLNSGSFDAAKRCYLNQLKAPVGIFLGGPCDIANLNGIEDYDALKVPKFKVHLDTGHSGTYGDTNGGAFGKAVLSFLEWQFRDSQKEKTRWADPKAPSSFVSQGWYNITSSFFPHYPSPSKYFNATFV